MDQILPPLPASSTALKDAEHLKLLAIFHFIFAGLALLGVAFLWMHFTIMNAAMNNPKMWEHQDMKGFSPQEFFAAFR